MLWFTPLAKCKRKVFHCFDTCLLLDNSWPYKFVHAFLRILLETGKVNLQANTPALQVSDKDKDGWITVTTPRGDVRTKAVVHATVRLPPFHPDSLSFGIRLLNGVKMISNGRSQNAWASHLLPEYSNIIFPSVSTVGAIKAPNEFLKNTGAQHWDGEIWNYHLQLPAPFNAIVLGGAKKVITHYPREWLKRDDDSKHLPGVPAYMETWPKNEVFAWPSDSEKQELILPAHEGGVWTGVVSPTADNFPFIGPAPGREGHFIAAGFGGHGMPRILLSTAHLTPIILNSLGVKWTAPSLVASYPPLPKPFVVTATRVEALKGADERNVYENEIKDHEESAKNTYCNEPLCLLWKAEA